MTSNIIVWNPVKKTLKFDEMSKTFGIPERFFFAESSLQMLRTQILRGGFRTAATSKVELFGIIINGFQPLTIMTKSSTLDVAVVLEPPLILL